MDSQRWMEIATVKHKLRERFPKTITYGCFLRALYENEIELRLLPWLCNPELTSIDVGAFTGIYTMGAYIYSKDVIAVEPQHRQAEALRRAVPWRVRVIEAALSRISGCALLKMEALGGGSMSRLDALPGLTDGWFEVPVPLMCLDDIDHGRVGFVKIDTEGHEIEVLEGSARTIAVDRPTMLIEAEERYRRGAVAQVVNFLKTFGYAGFFVHRNELRPIEAFDVETHQATSLAKGGRRSCYRDYINNFIFVDSARGALLPRKVPSGSRAMLDVARAWCSLYQRLALRS